MPMVLNAYATQLQANLVFGIVSKQFDRRLSLPLAEISLEAGDKAGVIVPDVFGIVSKRFDRRLSLPLAEISLEAGDKAGVIIPDVSTL
ncbi:unnamed protein product [Strongylus vulgaris]|uniref:Uncharacterized protein n=1 Tax=Strongylus vulgaris TaxID=40348 RepID=A0A3P7LTU3_STRVU|nr:unnamed protein product [Strongylus vulgaris]